MSRFCTSIEQSKILISLGFNQDFADMKYVNIKEMTGIDMYVIETRDIVEDFQDGEIPAWSMGALFDIAYRHGWYDDNTINIGRNSSDEVMDFLVESTIDMLKVDPEKFTDLLDKYKK